MVKYEKWVWTNGAALNEKQVIVNIDCGNVSWYDLMDELDKQPDRWVVCVAPEGYITWATSGPVSGVYAPSEGHTVIVTDDVPFQEGDVLRNFEWTSATFLRKEEPKPVVRTKEDIMADLLKLQEELKAM
ncbi:hypothetical protein pEp_SNUABM11_00011 [Erwinia phage pEp_SNUABM_11]|nr:hypothetical protein pEp_SNUABM11_00011 [Erwinia phage pEp_SNUABM_11]